MLSFVLALLVIEVCSKVKSQKVEELLNNITSQGHQEPGGPQGKIFYAHTHPMTPSTCGKRHKLRWHAVLQPLLLLLLTLGEAMPSEPASEEVSRQELALLLALVGHCAATPVASLLAERPAWGRTATPGPGFDRLWLPPGKQQRQTCPPPLSTSLPVSCVQQHRSWPHSTFRPQYFVLASSLS